MTITVKTGQINSVPHDRGLPLIGHAITAVRDPLAFLLRLSTRYGEAVKINVFGKQFYVIQSPAAFKHILQENAKNYFKPGAAKEMKRFLGEGLATSNGAVWLRQRRLMQPAFHRAKIESMITIIEQETNNLIQRWKSQPNPHTENINSSFLNLTLSNITKAMFGTDLQDQLDEIALVVGKLIKHATDQTTSIIKIPAFLPTESNLQFKIANERFEKIISRIIEKRQQESNNGSNHHDLLDMLMNSYDEESKTFMTTGQLRDEITTIFMAGHETTAQTLSWVFYNLATNRSVYEQVKFEADNITHGNLTLDKLQQLLYTKNVIEETLRIYPPVWVIARKSLEADQVTDTLYIPAGTTVLLNVYGMHHLATYWNSSETFNPMRFQAMHKPKNPPFAYLPFGGGQRICIGSQFAMMVMQTVVCRLVQHFEFEVPLGFHPTVVAGITLRAKGGICLTVKNRMNM